MIGYCPSFPIILIIVAVVQIFAIQSDETATSELYTSLLSTFLGDFGLDSQDTLKMASAQDVERSVANNSPSQDSSQPDDHFQ